MIKLEEMTVLLDEAVADSMPIEIRAQAEYYLQLQALCYVQTPENDARRLALEDLVEAGLISPHPENLSTYSHLPEAIG